MAILLRKDHSAYQKCERMSYRIATNPGTWDLWNTF